MMRMTKTTRKTRRSICWITAIARNHKRIIFPSSKHHHRLNNNVNNKMFFFEAWWRWWSNIPSYQCTKNRFLLLRLERQEDPGSLSTTIILVLPRWPPRRLPLLSYPRKITRWYAFRKHPWLLVSQLTGATWWRTTATTSLLSNVINNHHNHNHNHKNIRIMVYARRVCTIYGAHVSFGEFDSKHGTKQQPQQPRIGSYVALDAMFGTYSSISLLQ